MIAIVMGVGGSVWKKTLSLVTSPVIVTVWPFIVTVSLIGLFALTSKRNVSGRPGHSVAACALAEAARGPSAKASAMASMAISMSAIEYGLLAAVLLTESPS